MALTANQRQATLRDLMSDLGNRREACAVTKADLLAAVNAVDDWIDANAVAFNQAIPQPARGALTATQKAELLYRVAMKRYGR